MHIELSALLCLKLMECVHTFSYLMIKPLHILCNCKDVILSRHEFPNLECFDCILILSQWYHQVIHLFSKSGVLVGYFIFFYLGERALGGWMSYCYEWNQEPNCPFLRQFCYRVGSITDILLVIG